MNDVWYLKKTRHQANRQTNVATFQEDDIGASTAPDQSKEANDKPKEKAKEPNYVADNKLTHSDAKMCKIIFEMPARITVKLAGWQTLDIDARPDP